MTATAHASDAPRLAARAADYRFAALARRPALRQGGGLAGLSDTMRPYDIADYRHDKD